MKINLICVACWEDAYKRISGAADAINVKVPLQESKIYSCTCARGHEFTQCLLNAKFEILFQSAVLALKDDYYREAVTSFAAALERFYEFLIIVFVFEQRRNNRAGFDESWNSLSSSSERQIGAVNFLYYQLLGEPMPDFKKFIGESKLDLGRDKEKKDAIKFRNDITHKGLVPSYTHALNYGEGVNKYIRHVLGLLSKQNQPNLIEAFEDIINDELNVRPDIGASINSFFLNGKRIIVGAAGYEDSLISYMQK